MQYCTMQVVRNQETLALTLTSTSPQNITVQLETNFMNYRVKPKVFFSVNIALHCIAATFFFFAALKSRYLDFEFS